MLVQRSALLEEQEYDMVGLRSATGSGRVMPDEVRPTLLELRTQPADTTLGRSFEKPTKSLSTTDFITDGTPAVLKGDHRKAFGLLEDVKNFIPQIVRENNVLRQTIQQIQTQADEKVLLAQQQTREWMEEVDFSKEQIATLEALVLDLRSKLHKTESVVAIEKELSTRSVQEAAEAECLAKLFEDTVISSFGIGTMFQEALARVKAEAE